MSLFRTWRNSSSCHVRKRGTLPNKNKKVPRDATKVRAAAGDTDGRLFHRGDSAPVVQQLAGCHETVRAKKVCCAQKKRKGAAAVTSSRAHKKKKGAAALNSVRVPLWRQERVRRAGLSSGAERGFVSARTFPEMVFCTRTGSSTDRDLGALPRWARRAPRAVRVYLLPALSRSLFLLLFY